MTLITPAPAALPRDRFTDARALAQGGTATVFAAWDTQRGHAVAVKVLHEEWCAPRDELRQRFLDESLACRMPGFQHAGMVTIYETSPGGPAAPPYHVMELLSCSLSARLRESGVLRLPAALRLGAQVAGTLAALHAAGVVHRDLKPSNLLLSPDRRRVKLADFGMAKLPAGLPRALPLPTAQGARLGTAGYMPPEQWLDASRVAGAADVFGLGAVLYEALLGAPLFPGATARELRNRVFLQQPPDLPRAVPPRIAALLRRMVAKEPGPRPSAAECAAAFAAPEGP